MLSRRSFLGLLASGTAGALLWQPAATLDALALPAALHNLTAPTLVETSTFNLFLMDVLEALGANLDRAGVLPPGAVALGILEDDRGRLAQFGVELDAPEFDLSMPRGELREWFADPMAHAIADRMIHAGVTTVGYQPIPGGIDFLDAAIVTHPERGLSIRGLRAWDGRRRFLTRVDLVGLVQ